MRKRFWDYEEVLRVRAKVASEKEVMESVANDWDKIYNEYLD